MFYPPYTSAKEAADFILGRYADQDLWKDNKGNCFSSYIKTLIRADKPIVAVQETNHLFYINQDPQTGDFRKGVGYYQPDLDRFVVKQGSILMFHSKSNDAGIRYMMDNCEHIKENCYMLKKDMTFSSPSAAASVCLGRKGNGWLQWVDKNGRTLKEIYRN